MLKNAKSVLFGTYIGFETCYMQLFASRNRSSIVSSLEHIKITHVLYQIIISVITLRRNCKNMCQKVRLMSCQPLVQNTFLRIAMGITLGIQMITIGIATGIAYEHPMTHHGTSMLIPFL